MEAEYKEFCKKTINKFFQQNKKSLKDIFFNKKQVNNYVEYVNNIIGGIEKTKKELRITKDYIFPAGIIYMMVKEKFGFSYRYYNLDYAFDVSMNSIYRIGKIIKKTESYSKKITSNKINSEIKNLEQKIRRLQNKINKCQEKIKNKKVIKK